MEVALVYYKYGFFKKKCLKEYEIADIGLLTKIYIEIGINYQFLNEFNVALQYFEKALVVYEHV